METIELKPGAPAAPADLSTFNADDRLLCFSNSGQTFGYVKASLLKSYRYACRRRNLSNASSTWEPYGDLDYLKNLPGLLNLGCYLLNGGVASKLSPTNHYNFVNGATAALDGSMGDYMWGGNAHYEAYWIEGSYEYLAASLSPIPGKYNWYIPQFMTSALGIGVMDRTNIKLVSVINNSSQYRGGNNDAAKDALYTTQLGRAATQISALDFSTYAKNKGDDRFNAHTERMAFIIANLFVLTYGTNNVQATYNAALDANGLRQGGFGPGVTTYGNWSTDFGTYPFLPTSVGVELADNCGLSSYAVMNGATTLYTALVPCFFGLKNFYGYLSRWTTDAVVSSNGTIAQMYINKSIRTKLASTVDLTKQVLAGNWAIGEGYITSMLRKNGCLLPQVYAGSESTYYNDYGYGNASSGVRVVARGGRAINYGYAGVSYAYAGIGPSDAIAYVSSPLCWFADELNPEPALAE
ncbi:hypothetical protein [uncultured Bacteroides sp.]|uniref:hypothetical protein n=1 Tax=uncultured Bacteroides sp. TaxID=162156 RepID=UPI002AAA86FD|nr:hypothetical protein [uncultured Bacteroides sp.]